MFSAQTAATGPEIKQKGVVLGCPRRPELTGENWIRSGGISNPLGRFKSNSDIFVRLWRVNGKSSGVQIRWFLSLFHMELNYLRNPKVRNKKLGKLQNGTIPSTLTGTKLRRSNERVS